MTADDTRPDEGPDREAVCVHCGATRARCEQYRWMGCCPDCQHVPAPPTPAVPEVLRQADDGSFYYAPPTPGEEGLRARYAERQMIHDDIAAILRALGLGDHARPYSTHDVVQRDILPALAAREDADQGAQAALAAVRALADKYGEHAHHRAALARDTAEPGGAE